MEYDLIKVIQSSLLQLRALRKDNADINCVFDAKITEVINNMSNVLDKYQLKINSDGQTN